MARSRGPVESARSPRVARRARLIAALAAGAALGLGLFVPLRADQSGPGAACRISGHAAVAGKPLPGVSILVTTNDTLKGATSTDPDGTYHVALPPGAYRLTAELMGFSRVELTLTIGGGSCDQTVDLPLTLAPRGRTPVAPPARAQSSTAAAPGATPPGATPGSTGRANQPASASTGDQRFERLAVQTLASSENLDVSPAERDTSDPAARLLLPPGFSTEGPTEAVAINGNMANFDRGMINDRFAALGRGEFDPVTGEVAPGFALGDGGPGAGRGGFQGRGGRGGVGDPGGRGRGGADGFVLGGRGGPQNGYIATMNYSFGGSVLDSAPYQLRPDSPTPKRPYTRQNFGFTIGGPIRIPHVYNGTRRTSFIASYTGNRGSSLFDQFATVPGAAMRAGDFSTSTVPIVDPSTGRPFEDNRIPAGSLSPAAIALLQFLPLPNLSGDAKNFHRTTTTASTTDNLNLRLIHSFTPAAAGRGRVGGFGRGGGGRFGGGGGRGRQGTSVTLNAQLQYRRNNADQANVFPALGGRSSGSSLTAPVTLNIQHNGMLHNISVNLSQTRSATTNQYAFVQDVTGLAGIGGVSTDPFDWGVPALSFSSVTSLRDLTPTTRTDRRLTAGYTWMRPLRRHLVRAGGDIRIDRSTSEIDPNPRGAFVFTGLYAGGSNAARGSGLDFADFLLGLPQQASVQYGPGSVALSGKAMSLFVQDDWRKSASLTFNVGVRYELLWPFVERHGEMVNLDVAPGFTAAAPVISGGDGPYTGRFPKGLIQPDTNNVAPRLGVAWRIKPGTVLRGGYGISYNSGSYSSIARQLVSQPPFAVTATTIGTAVVPLSLADPFGAIQPTLTTNNYGVARDYALGRVQTWNGDLSRDLGPLWNVGAGYTEIRGSSLDIVRAPNRGPNGLRIQSVQPFLWQTSEGSSILHAATFRLQRRASHGAGGTLTYTLARSRDNASTVGGGAVVVAQDDQNLAAEWGPSSFDRRHQVAGTISIELPFGPNRRWLSGGGLWASLLENWRLAANYTWQSGTPHTPLVQGSASDAARGTNGTLRANYDGEPIQIADPSIERFFNTSAFSIPAPGTFGNAGRNLIVGPGSRQLNAQLSRDVRSGRTRTLTLAASATNLLNDVNYAAIDTIVNSPTFGQVLSVRPRRSVQLNLRFRF